MNVSKLRVRGAAGAAACARIRWELFVFAEIRDVLPALEPDTVAVLWEGARADPERWCRALAEAGYDASPAGTTAPPRRDTLPAA
ncbi:MAG TPA: hypothetical protein VFB42_04485 [Gaiellaceae bacterium]|nr:hypothetical protein [Gaiellaceae bacterium]